MKKSTIIISLIFALLIGATCQAQTLLAKWTFPTGNPSDSLADGGLPVNLTKAIRTDGGTSAIDFSKNGLTTKSAQATGWDNGAMTKSWLLEISSLGYDHLKISSKQQSGGNNPGPRDYAIQYRIGSGGSWTDVPNATIVTANDWTTSVVDSVPLPGTCANQPSLFLRWLMTTNTSSTGGTVLATGIDKIDDIYITGKQLSSAVNESDSYTVCRIFPNPATGNITIDSKETVMEAFVINCQGICWYRQPAPDPHSFIINTSSLPSGIYIVKIIMLSGKTTTKKIILD